MCQSKDISVLLLVLFIACNENGDYKPTGDNNNKVFTFSGTVKDCLTKEAISGATISVERRYCVREEWYGSWQCAETSTAWYSYHTDKDGHFSFSFIGKEGDGFSLFVGADNYWGHFCGCAEYMTGLISGLNSENLQFELVPFNPEKKRPIKIDCSFKNGSWPDFGMVYDVYQEDLGDGWADWIYRDTLLKSECNLLCNYIVFFQGMHEDPGSSAGYSSGYTIFDTLVFTTDLQDTAMIEEDTIIIQVEFDCQKDTLLLSVLD